MFHNFTFVIFDVLRLVRVVSLIHSKLEIMNNNNENYKNHKDSSLGSSISAISHPFDTFQEKIDCVMEKWDADVTTSIETKKKAFREIFKTYYDNLHMCGFYGLSLTKPW